MAAAPLEGFTAPSRVLSAATDNVATLLGKIIRARKARILSSIPYPFPEPKHGGSRLRSMGCRLMRHLVSSQWSRVTADVKGTAREGECVGGLAADVWLLEPVPRRSLPSCSENNLWPACRPGRGHKCHNGRTMWRLTDVSPLFSAYTRGSLCPVNKVTTSASCPRRAAKGTDERRRYDNALRSVQR